MVLMADKTLLNDRRADMGSGPLQTPQNAIFGEKMLDIN